MTDSEELAYIRGSRMAWSHLLGLCIRELCANGAAEDPAVTIARLVSEREAAVAALRSVCEEHGDNDWEPTLHLADVIEKHLGRYLDDER